MMASAGPSSSFNRGRRNSNITLKSETSSEPLEKILQGLINSVCIQSSSSEKDSFIQDDSQNKLPEFWPSDDGKVVEESPKYSKRFRSKSAKRENVTSKRIFHQHPKTAKPKSTSEDKNWMQVLEELSQGDNEEPEKTDILLVEADNENNDNDRLSDSSSFCTEDFMQDGGRNVFTAGSEATSLGWADDAVEAETTMELARQWATIESVFHGDVNSKPLEMSSIVYDEILIWKRAFGGKSVENRIKNIVPKRKHEDFQVEDIQTNGVDFDDCLPHSNTRENFLQSWLESLTEFPPNSDEPTSLPTKINSDNDPIIRNFRAQRPISSRYRNRALGQKNVSDIDVLRVGPQHEKIRNRIPSAWSRHNENMANVKTEIGEKPDTSAAERKNFLSWLFFDENEEIKEFS